MNNRETVFRKKFENAAQILGVKTSDIVSIKIRETVARHQDYDDLFKNIELLPNISTKPINGSLQGNGYIIEDNERRIIIVEHETGLEILYIAGSIASLIQLIQFIVNLWNGRRNHFDYSTHFGNEGIEIRRIDNKGQFIEVRDVNILLNTEAPIIKNLPSDAISNNDIFDQLQKLENELLKINKRVENIKKGLKRTISKKDKRKKVN